MTTIAFSDVLSLAQTIAIIATLLMTLYFSRRQLQALSLDMETRVLNDLDEKLHSMASYFIENPNLVKTIYDVPTEITSDVPFLDHVLFIASHAYHMRQRKILGDNEWAGWLAWITNTFRYGTMKNYWSQNRMDTWLDPAFRNFINNEILGTISADSKQVQENTSS